MRKIFSVFILCIFATSSVQAEITNTAAGIAKKELVKSAGQNAAQGKSFLDKCKANPVFCGMAVLAFTQVVMSLADSGKASNTKSASECSGPYCGGSGYAGGIGGTASTQPGVPEDLLGRIQDDVNKNLKELGNKGYSYNASKNAVNTPGGSVPASAFGSEDGLKAMGMTDEELSDLKKNASVDNTKGLGDGFEGGGGRKAKAGSGYETASSFDMNKYLASLNGTAARGVAGLEKKYGSDQIGVAQDNIFKMVHRRYEEKKTTLHP